MHFCRSYKRKYIYQSLEIRSGHNADKNRKPFEQMATQEEVVAQNVEAKPIFILKEEIEICEV